jgi:hypothetical protein
VKALRTAVAANARHLASLLVKQAAVLLTSSAKTQRKANKLYLKSKCRPKGGIFEFTNVK